MPPKGGEGMMGQRVENGDLYKKALNIKEPRFDKDGNVIYTPEKEGSKEADQPLDKAA